MKKAKSSSSSAFKQRIASLTEQILDRSKIVPIDYVLSIISEGALHVPDCALILKTPKLFKTPDDIRSDRDFLILPYLSFQVRDGSVIRFVDANEAYDVYDQCIAEQMTSLYDTPFFTAFLLKKPFLHRNEHIVDAIAQLVGFYFHFYEYPLLLGRSASRYARLLSTRDPPASELFDILDNISADYQCSIAYVTRLNENITATHGECVPYLITSPFFSERFNYSVSRGQVASSFVRLDDKNVFFTLIPHLQHLSDGSIQSGCILLSRLDEPLNELVPSFVGYFVSRSFHERSRSGQSSIIENLNDIRRRVLDGMRAGEFQTYSSRRQILREELDKWCKSLSDITGAHSVTVRLYNRFSDTLNVFAAYDKTTSDQPEARIKIGIREYRTSLNAAVFRLRAPSNPVRIDDVKELILPADLRAAGFKTTLNARPATASEICASIWNADAAIGTINLEGPEKRGFRSDDLFIGTIASRIGDLFSLTQETLSLPSLRQIARANDAAHGAAGLEFDALLRTVPPEIQSQLPLALIESVTRFEDFRKAYRRDISEMASGASSITKLVAEITSAYDRSLVPFVSEKNPELFVVRSQRGKIAPAIALSILRLAELVFDNAAKHSRIDLDRITIIVGPGRSRGGRRMFNLRYRSTHAPIDPDVLDSFGLAPIRKDGKVRYGAFLLGYQARALGGALDVKRDLTSRIPAPLEFHLSVPL
jgi:hypothetical protein